MSDQISVPNLTTTLTNQKFKLHVRAYRQLSKGEMIQQLLILSNAKKWKKIPTKGEYTVITTIGFDQ